MVELVEMKGPPTAKNQKKKLGPLDIHVFGLVRFAVLPLLLSY